MPVEIRDLQSVPRPNIQRHLAQVRNVINNYWPEDDYQLLDTLYKYKPSPNPYDWVPPFKSEQFLWQNIVRLESHMEFCGHQQLQIFLKNQYSPRLRF